jgi:tetratricopeptide (TPR) repeat protein
MAFAGDNWIRVASTNIVVISNAPEGDTRALVLKLEAFRAVVSRTFGVHDVPAAPVILLFKDNDSFSPFKRNAGELGFFNDRGVEDVVAATNLRSEGLDYQHVLFHEFTHVLTAPYLHEWPPWLREGIAEVYSMFEIEGNKVTIGDPNPRSVYYLRKHDIMPLKLLVKQAPKSHDVRNVDLFYTQSWALCHYLMFADKRAHLDQLIQFCRSVQSGTDSEGIFRQVFQTDYAAMEGQLREYIHKDEYPAVQLVYKDLTWPQEVKVSPLVDGEIQFWFGNLLVDCGDKSRAEYYFKQSLARAPQLDLPYEGLGYVALLRKQYKEARSYLEEALKRNDRNYRAHYCYAGALYGEAAGGKEFADFIDPERAKVIVDELDAAIRIRPRFAFSYDLLARLCLNPGESLDEGMRLNDMARKLKPRETGFVLTRAMLQIHRQEFEEAKKSLGRVLETTMNDESKAVVASIQRELEKAQSPTR